MILVDTSAWVEYLRATGSPAHLEVRSLIEGARELATTDPVVMEVLAGSRNEERASALRRLLLRCHHLPVAGPGDFEQAATLYRVCRARGVTVRSLLDCLIAQVAIREKVPVLEQDRDYRIIAEHTSLRLHAPGSGA